MTANDNMSLVRRILLEIWNGLDLDLADQLVSPTYINHGGLIPNLVTGPEAVKFAIVLHHTAFPHLIVWESGLVVDDNLVELRWRAEFGPRVGEKQPRRSRAIARGTSLFVCRDNRIVESWTTWLCARSIEPFTSKGVGRPSIAGLSLPSLT